jgi:hypothetical protein
VSIDTALANVLAALDARETAAANLQAAVTEAKAAGATWAQIGAVMGTTKQAAAQRFTKERT